MAVRVAKLPMSAVLRTRTTGENAGYMKVLVEASGERILGFTMIGPEAGEVMAAVQTAMLGGLPTRFSATPSWRTRRWPRGSMPCSPPSRRRGAEPPEDAAMRTRRDFVV